MAPFAMIFFILLYGATKRHSRIKNPKFSSLVFIARSTRRQVPPVLKSIFIFRTLTPSVFTADIRALTRIRF